MATAASLTAILIATFLPFMIIMFSSGERWKAEQDKARARRLADARMNARLLRLNL